MRYVTNPEMGALEYPSLARATREGLLPSLPAEHPDEVVFDADGSTRPVSQAQAACMYALRREHTAEAQAVQLTSCTRSERVLASLDERR
jgi:hypothetical protein